MNTQDKLALMRTQIKSLGKAIIAYSGGVDSTLVLKIATEELGSNSLGVIASSPSLANQELIDAKSVAFSFNANLEIIFTTEMENESYQINPNNRCYFCKTELHDKLRQIAQEKNIPYILDGINADDALDYRPGMLAAKEHNVISPLKDAGITKDEIREIAKSLNLPNWNKPSSPCLSSRIPYGTKITMDALRKVEKAEQFIRNLGVQGNLRVRYLEKIAKIEVDTKEMPLIAQNNDEINRYFRYIGFESVELDLRGFRSGRLNDVILGQNVEINGT
jgi:pyridinium-3,5-biscarboxylic acid mononucleotide sulfurtransferase